jgi:hypothetical protein
MSKRIFLNSWYSTQVAHPLSRPCLDAALIKLGIGVNHWSKDLCPECEILRARHEPVNLSEHWSEKEKAMKFKRQMKAAALGDESLLLVAMDVEAALTVPKVNVGVAYFKLKMNAHNFTLYNLITKRVSCYFFSEQDANLKAPVFSCCIKDFILREREKRPAIRKVQLWSDNCSYQNKNSYLSNVLLQLAIEHNLIIEQHFLVRGHTHLECDTVHAAIERRGRNEELHLMEDYERVFKECLVDPNAVEVHRLRWDFFEETDLSMMTSIRPGRRAGDPTVNDLRALRYSPDGTVEFKILVDDEFKALPQPIKIPTTFPEPQKMFAGRIPLKPDKRKHMEELAVFIPIEKRDEFKHYYQNN